MNLIICIDDNGGISFNNRRLSRDKVLCERILSFTKNKTLWMNKYSYKIFSAENICVDNEFLSKAKSDDFCFVENIDFLQFLDNVNKIIVYKWNRVYPSDLKLDKSILNNKSLISTVDFKGNSHEKITEEMYE